MRYQLNQQLWTIALQLVHDDSGEPVSHPHSIKPVPGLYTITGIRFHELTIAEHHRVPGEWSDEIQHDGFVAIDRKGNEWYNQMPRASYGQLGDDADGDFKLTLPNKMYAEARASGNELPKYDDVVAAVHSKGLDLAAYDLCRFMGALDGGAVDDEDQLKRYKEYPCLKEKLDAISARVQKEFHAATGKKLVSYTERFGTDERKILFKRWRVE